MHLPLGFLLPILSSLFALGLSEVVLYGYYLGSRVDTDTVMIVPDYNLPFVYTRTPNNVATVARKTTRTNNAGFRRLRDTAEGRSPKTVRILSYGDSIGHGFGVEDTEQYTHRLESLLNNGATDHPWEVLSTFRGSSPSVYTFHVRADHPRFHPDWIMVEIELQNDLSDEALLRLGARDETGMPRTIYGARYVVSLEGLVINNLSSAVPLLSRTVMYSAAITAFGRWRSETMENPLFGPEGSPYYYNVGADRYLLTKDSIDQAWDDMFESLAAIKRFAESNQSRFLLVIVAGRDAFAKDANADGVKTLIQKAAAQAKQREIMYVDTYPYLAQAGGKDLFMDFCHPNPLGHEAIARALYDFFAKETQLPAS